MALILNCGFYNTKVENANGKFIYPTKIQESEEGRRTLEVENLTYEIGVGARDINSKTQNLAHQLCTEYSILKYAECREIDLVTALPFSWYLNKAYREQYQNRLLGTHKGIVDGTEKEIIVRHCTVFAEGAAAYLPYKSVLKNISVGVLDIGGNTINCMIYERGELLKDTITTLDLGMIKLERELIDALNIRKGWFVQDYELRDIIENNECDEVVEQVIMRHLQAVRQKLKEKKWNLDRLTLFATGGGSKQLKRHLEKAFTMIIVSDDGIWDNLKGLKKVGGEIYG